MTCQEAGCQEFGRLFRATGVRESVVLQDRSSEVSQEPPRSAVQEAGSSSAVTSSRLGGVKIFEFGIGGFRVSRCFGCHFFGRGGRVGVFPEDG